MKSLLSRIGRSGRILIGLGAIVSLLLVAGLVWLNTVERTEAACNLPPGDEFELNWFRVTDVAVPSKTDAVFKLVSPDNPGLVWECPADQVTVRMTGETIPSGKEEYVGWRVETYTGVGGDCDSGSPLFLTSPPPSAVPNEGNIVPIPGCSQISLLTASEDTRCFFIKAFCDGDKNCKKLGDEPYLCDEGIPFEIRVVLIDPDLDLPSCIEIPPEGSIFYYTPEIKGIPLSTPQHPISVTWEVADKAMRPIKGLTIDPDSGVLRVTPEARAGDLFVTATVTDVTSGEGCPETVRLRLDCCGCDYRVGSGRALLTEEGDMEFSMSLGRSIAGESAGSLFLRHDSMKKYHGKSYGLSLSKATGDVVREDGRLRQVSTPDALADIVTIPGGGYEVSFYHHDDVTYTSSLDVPYEIDPAAAPMTTWRISASGVAADGTGTVLAEKRDGGTTVVKHEFERTDDAMTLRSGDATSTLREEIVDHSGISWPEERILTRTVSDGGVTTDRKIVEHRAPLAHGLGDVVTQRDRFTSTTESDTDTFTYYRDSQDIDTARYGSTKEETRHDGSWARYTYDADGRKSTAETPFLDSASTASSSDVRVTEYAYSHTGDSGTIRTAHPRVVTEKVEGTVVSKTYHRYEGSDDYLTKHIVERAATTTAAYGTAGNLRTTTEYHASTGGTGIKGRPKSVEHPDGRKSTHDYEYGTFSFSSATPGTSFTAGTGTHLRTTTTHGTTGHPTGIPGKTTISEHIENTLGTSVMSLSHVKTASSKELLSWKHTELDDYGYPSSILGSDGTLSEMETCPSCNPGCGRYTLMGGPDGVEHAYVYDALGHKTEEVVKGHSGGGHTIPAITNSLTYSASGSLLTSTKASGSLSLATSSIYDWAGRATTHTDAAGIATTTVYDDAARKTTTTRAGLSAESVRYADGRTKTVKKGGVRESTHTYGAATDGSRWTKTYRGPDGDSSSAWSKSYSDVLGRGTKEERPAFDSEAPMTTTREYFTSSDTGKPLGSLKKSSVTDGDFTRTTLYGYDELGSQTTNCLDIDNNGIIDLDGDDRVSATHSEYVKEDDVWYRVSESIIYAEDGSADKTTNSVRKARLTDLGTSVSGYPEGTVMTAESISIDLRENETISRTYINRDAKTVWQVVDHPDSDTDSISKTVNGRAVSSESKTGLEAIYVYDDLGRRIGVDDPRTGESTVGYNDKGQVAWQSDAAGNTNWVAYDEESGRRVAVTNALDQVTHYKHDTEGHLQATWGNVYPVAYEYDDSGRMSAMYTYRGTTDIVTYEGMSLVLPDMDKTQWLYDEATGLLTNKVYADGNGTAYSYTSDGKLETRTWARDESTTYSYDDCCGALTNISYSATNTPDVIFTYDRIGRKDTVTDAAGTWTFQYDPDTLALTNEVLVTHEGITNTLARSQDAYGRNSGIALDDDYTVGYDYDTAGRFSQVDWTFGATSYTATYSFVENSNMIGGYDVPVGANTFKARKVYEPDRNLISSISNLWNTTSISTYAYGNDAIGRRTNRIDSGSITNAFGYNVRSELVDATMGDNMFDYEYDPIGNRLSASQSVQSVSSVVDYLANDLNQYTNIAVEGEAPAEPLYDADGNMLTHGGWTYSWNGENRLIQASNSTAVIAFSYDYMGRRFQKVVNSPSSVVTNRFVYDGWAMIREDVATSVSEWTNRYVYGLDLSGSMQGAGTIGGLLSADLDGTAIFYCYDANGNVTELVNTDGTTAAKYQYGPFGGTLLADDTDSSGTVDANPFMFSAKYLDDTTEWYYYGFRYYSPELGRWLNRDPLGEFGGLNLQAFARNSPVNVVDIDGRFLNFGGGLFSVGLGYTIAWALDEPYSPTEAAIDFLVGSLGGVPWGKMIKAAKLCKKIRVSSRIVSRSLKISRHVIDPATGLVYGTKVIKATRHGWGLRMAVNSEVRSIAIAGGWHITKNIVKAQLKEEIVSTSYSESIQYATPGDGSFGLSAISSSVKVTINSSGVTVTPHMDVETYNYTPPAAPSGNPLYNDGIPDTIDGTGISIPALP